MNTGLHALAGPSRYQATVWMLGIGHGFSDAAAGYLIGHVSHDASFSQTSMAVFIYNLLAFGGQVPAGFWLDRVGRYRMPAVVSLLGMVVALSLFAHPFFWMAIVLAGVSSAIFHVSGGAVTLLSFPGKSKAVGTFSAFGVLGLALGGWAGTLQVDGVRYLLMAGLVLVLITLAKATMPPGRKQALPGENLKLDDHDYVMILLLMAIALRSAVWNSIQLLYSHQYDWLIYTALAAMVGKLAGGWLADRVPWKPYALSALAVALPALGWGYRKLFWLMLGTGLLQSLTPLSVVALQRLFPGRPASVSGGTFGLAIAVGGLLYLGPSLSLVTQLLLFGLLAWGLYYSVFSTDSLRPGWGRKS